MWVIKHKKRGNYYQKTIVGLMKHFVLDSTEARQMPKWEAKKILSKFKRIEEYEIVRVK